MERSEGRISMMPAWDILIAGGGIIGAAVARDAALRGLRTALVEQHDFASGSSSRTTRLLHGGLRYLSQGRLRMVREAGREKRTVLGIAPEICRRQPFILPAWNRRGWPRWMLEVGVQIYDRCCASANEGKSIGLSARQVREEAPWMNPETMAGGVRYYDGLVHDARLVIDTLKSAEQHGAQILNYTRLDSAARYGGEWVCRLTAADGSTQETRARLVVNATGVRIGQFPQSLIRCTPTKGVHLLIRRDRMPLRTAIAALDGSRIFFAIPWAERIILGTTDTPHEGPLDEPRVADEDVSAIMSQAGRLLPGAHLSASDVTGAWAGLRPLVANRSARHSSDISRKHAIRTTPDGWMDVAGGKLTTHRLIAEQAVDRALRMLACPHRPSRTGSIPIPAGIPLFQMPQQPLVRQFCRAEYPVHIDDVMRRRTDWQWSSDSPVETAGMVCEEMARSLAWTPQTRSSEWKRYLAGAGLG